MEKVNDLAILGIGITVLAVLALPKKKTNEQHLQTLNPSVKNRFIGFITELKQKGYKPTITSSHRNIIQQAVQKTKDKRNAPPGKSSHGRARSAVDLVAVYNGKTLNKATSRELWLQSGIPAIAAKYGLKWGGNIKGYYDPVHYEA